MNDATPVGTGAARSEAWRGALTPEAEWRMRFFGDSPCEIEADPMDDMSIGDLWCLVPLPGVPRKTDSFPAPLKIISAVDAGFNDMIKRYTAPKPVNKEAERATLTREYGGMTHSEWLAKETVKAISATSVSPGCSEVAAVGCDLIEVVDGKRAQGCEDKELAARELLGQKEQLLLAIADVVDEVARDITRPPEMLALRAVRSGDSVVARSTVAPAAMIFPIDPSCKARLAVTRGLYFDEGEWWPASYMIHDDAGVLRVGFDRCPKCFLPGRLYCGTPVGCLCGRAGRGLIRYSRAARDDCPVLALRTEDYGEFALIRDAMWEELQGVWGRPTAARTSDVILGAAVLQPRVWVALPTPTEIDMADIVQAFLDDNSVKWKDYAQRVMAPHAGRDYGPFGRVVMALISRNALAFQLHIGSLGVCARLPDLGEGALYPLEDLQMAFYAVAGAFAAWWIERGCRTSDIIRYFVAKESRGTVEALDNADPVRCMPYLRRNRKASRKERIAALLA